MRDISFFGKKRYVKVFWTENKIQYIENQKIVTELICSFQRQCTRTGYYSVDNNCVIAKEGDVINLKGACVKHLNKRKIKIILDCQDKDLQELIWKFKNIVLDDDHNVSTKYYIDNILFKNGMFSLATSPFDYIYCVVDINSQKNTIYVIIDTFCINNPSKIIKLEVIRKGIYYVINNDQSMNNDMNDMNDLCSHFATNMKI
jgi:hypothetical protein